MNNKKHLKCFKISTPLQLDNISENFKNLMYFKNITVMVFCIENLNLHLMITTFIVFLYGQIVF